MSSAFVKEDEEQHWLHEVKGTVSALQAYLTRENQGIRVFEKDTSFDQSLKKEVHVMSNGLRYTKDEEGRWYVL
jgi:hypothetical protein